MEKLKTAKGKEFDCDYLNPFLPAAQVNAQVYNVSLADVANVFSDPSETAQLCFENTCLTGYTKLLAIIPAGSGTRIVLGKE